MQVFPAGYYSFLLQHHKFALRRKKSNLDHMFIVLMCEMHRIWNIALLLRGRNEIMSTLRWSEVHWVRRREGNKATIAVFLQPFICTSQFEQYTPEMPLYANQTQRYLTLTSSSSSCCSSKGECSVPTISSPEGTQRLGSTTADTPM